MKQNIEEKFRKGDFNFAHFYSSSPDEMIIIFGKSGEKQRNYLRFKNYNAPNQVKLAEFLLTLEEAKEILKTIREKPEKVKEILERLEKRKK